MAGQGFSRVIVGRDGRRWQLPPAEYVHGGTGQSLDGIIAKVKAATAAIGRSNTSTCIVHRCDDWNGYSVKPA